MSSKWDWCEAIKCEYYSKSPRVPRLSPGKKRSKCTNEYGLEPIDCSQGPREERKEERMQEIKYKDGSETKEIFDSFEDALEDARKKGAKKSIKKLTITMMIPSKKRRRG